MCRIQCLILGENNEEGSSELAGVAATQGEVSYLRYFVNPLHNPVIHLLLWSSGCFLLLGPVAGIYTVGG